MGLVSESVDRGPPTRSIALYLIGLCLLLPAAAAAAITVTGADHQSITLAAPARRIVSLAPDLTELVYDAGAGAALVGASSYSDYPQAAKKLLRIGDAFRFDLERVLALRPDLVLAWQSGTPVTAIERMRALGLPVLVIGSQQLTDIARNLELIGKVTGHEAQAKTAAREFLAGLASLRQEYAGRPPVRVFYEISSRPLYTVGGRQIISRMIELCGGRNIFSELKVPAATVSMGAVLARDPQAVITGGDDQAAARLKAWHRWPMVSAVRTHSLFSISNDLLARATPRILQGGKQLCEDLEKARESRLANSE
ncbi:MAG: cobalamin-binding protein [Gammaproteobacteria bacterium]|nr:cobalamin-binding protein [Gammaproteobacteria bacterium]MDE2346268.1 cobalamin-binding protein [Gammaproteobacteria bacterium]